MGWGHHRGKISGLSRTSPPFVDPASRVDYGQMLKQRMAVGRSRIGETRRAAGAPVLSRGFSRGTTMALANILVHLDSRPRTAARVGLSLRIAERCGACLTGMFAERAEAHVVGTVVTWPSAHYVAARDRAQGAFAAATAAATRTAPPYRREPRQPTARSFAARQRSHARSISSSSARRKMTFPCRPNCRTR